MKELNSKPKEYSLRTKKSKFSDQNEPPKNSNIGLGSNSSSKLKSASIWGSNIVKGLSGSGDRKSKIQSTTMNKLIDGKPNSKVKLKRGGIISDLSCSVTGTQIHPHGSSMNKSQDLFVEIENLRALLNESKQREFRNANLNLELEREVKAKQNEIDSLNRKIRVLESEKIDFKNGYGSLEKVGLGKGNKNSVQMEVLQLRRLNKELQLQKRNLSAKVASLESQLSNFSEVIFLIFIFKCLEFGFIWFDIRNAWQN